MRFGRALSSPNTITVRKVYVLYLANISCSIAEPCPRTGTHGPSSSNWWSDSSNVDPYSSGNPADVLFWMHMPCNRHIGIFPSVLRLSPLHSHQQFILINLCQLAWNRKKIFVLYSTSIKWKNVPYVCSDEGSRVLQWYRKLGNQQLGSRL